MSTKIDLRKLADSVKNDYFEENQSNLLFRNKQRHVVAALVTDKLSLVDWISRAIYRDKNKASKVIVDFTILKLFAHPAIFPQISHFGICSIQKVVAENGFYCMHINLDTLSITTLDRFRPLIDTFFGLIPASDSMFAQKIHSVTIYNPPAFFDALYKIVRRFISSDCSHLQLFCLPKDPETNQRFHDL